MSIRNHPDWKDILPHIRIEYYDRDGGHSHPRNRIEIKSRTPHQTKLKLLAVECPCVACGRMIFPIRRRSRGGRVASLGHLYFACACDLDTNKGCSRGRAAQVEYDKIVEAVEDYEATQQPSLI